MGATPYEGGVSFRVWAPFASAVAVAGDFNGWSPEATPLVSEGSGTWSADVPGTRPGAAYKFVIRNGATTLWKRDPYTRVVTSATGNSVVYDPTFDWGTTPYGSPGWDEVVIYELHVGTFNDALGTGPGSFASVARRLDYLASLGINAIELMPSMEFGEEFSWGYDPADIFAIEDVYGGPDELKKLIRAAHERGIAVLFDVVYNHFGPNNLDLWQFDGWEESGGGGIYFYNDRRSETGWGNTRPDYGRGEVRQFIADNARLWLEEFRLDGLRWDATAYIRNIYGNNNDPANDIPDGWGLMQWVNRQADDAQPWKLMIAEDLRGNHWVTKPPAEGGAGFDAQWDGDFVHPVRNALIPASDGGRSMGALAGAVAHNFGGDPLRRVIYTESHDEVANGHERLPEEIWPGNAGSWYSRKRSTLGAALVFTAPGIPMIFQGQEILEDKWFREDNPIDWTREVTYAGILNLYRDLIHLRRNWFDTTRGLRGRGVQVHHVNDVDNVIAFHRWDRGGPRDDVVVVANVSVRPFATYRIGLPRSGVWRVRFNSDWQGYSNDFGSQPSFDAVADGGPQDGMPARGNVEIGPYTAIILSQDD